MKNYSKIFLFIAAVALVFLLILYSKIETIPETSKRIRIQMVADSVKYKMTPYPHQQNIYSLHIEITGQLDGSAYMCFRQKNDDYAETLFINEGHVDQHVNIEWKIPYCQMTYYPVDAKKGNLLLKYRFFSSKH